MEKSQAGQVQTTLTLSPAVSAPVEEGQVLGQMEVTVDGQSVAKLPLVADRAVPRLTVGGIYRQLLSRLFMAA